MSYSAPTTQVTGALITAAIWNQDIRDNVSALKSPPTDTVAANEASDYTTTSTTFANVDAAGDPDMSLAITTAGGDVFITFAGSVQNPSGGYIFLDVLVDGATRIGTDDGIIAAGSTTAWAATRIPISFRVIKQGLSSGAHTFNLQWKVNTGTGNMFVGAATANGDLHPQFTAREES